MKRLKGLLQSSRVRVTSQLRATSHVIATSHDPSAKALGKRRLRKIAEDAESDQEDDSEVTSLPEI